MGLVKREFEEYEALQPMRNWIEDNYDAVEEDEEPSEWQRLVREYEEHCENARILEEAERWEYELKGLLKSDSAQIFHDETLNIKEILAVPLSADARFSLLVMLHGHTIATLESYLSSIFIRKVANSDDLIKKLLKSDPEFSKMTFSINEIYDKHENIKSIALKHLRDLIFHKINKVKPMYKEVLGCDFGDVTWLFKAISIRHHCVHRTGRQG